MAWSRAAAQQWYRVSSSPPGNAHWAWFGVEAVLASRLLQRIQAAKSWGLGVLSKERS